MILTVNGLSFKAYHGVYAKEKKNGQTFVLDIIMDIGDGPVKDNLDKTVDYSAVASEAVKFATQKLYDLLETLAENLATHLLQSFPLLRGVTITIHKPFAPVPIPFSDVTVTVSKSWHTVYLGLGSNLGDRGGHLNNAVTWLKKSEVMKMLAISKTFETAPYGVTDQGDFLNSALKVETFLSPRQLLALIKNIEVLEKRVPTRHWGERTLDIDILLYDDCVIGDSDLIIPHIELQKRTFVLDPLQEIAAGVVHPVLKKTIQTLWEESHASHVALM